MKVINYKQAYEKQKEIFELMTHEPEKDDELRLHVLYKSEMERLQSELTVIESSQETLQSAEEIKVKLFDIIKGLNGFIVDAGINDAEIKPVISHNAIVSVAQTIYNMFASQFHSPSLLNDNDVIKKLVNLAKTIDDECRINDDVSSGYLPEPEKAWLDTLYEIINEYESTSLKFQEGRVIDEKHCNNPITSEDTCTLLAKKKTCEGCKFHY
jgi:hypothetical protein